MSSPTHAAESALQISPPMESSPSLEKSADVAVPIEAPTTTVQIEESLHDHESELHDVAITMAEEKHDLHVGDAHKQKKKHKHGHGHSHSASSKEATKNTIKFIIMIVLVFIFFVAEIVMGYLGNSLALISDAFHMLSDGMSLVIGLVALRLSTKGPGKKLSYGWGRTEILGGLINGVFLLSVVLFVYMEAIQRFFSPEPIEKPYYVLGVGILGLIVNIIGMIMFGGHHHHGHDHGHDHGHGHSHGHSHGHKKKSNKKKDGKKKKHGDKHEHEEGHQHKHEDSDEHKHDHDHDEHHHHEHEEGHKHDHDHDHHGHDHKHDEEKGQKKKKKIVNLNMAGVFLHVLGDFLGSIGVVIAAALSWAFDPAKNRWVIYIDPSISVILNTIILFSTIPLVKNCAKVLLQIVPDDIDVTKLKEKIMAVKGVIDIHELHIWKLVNTKVVCSVHIVVNKEDNFMILASKIKNILHEHSVHSSTIQPEFVDTSLKSPSEGSPTATMAADLCQLACSTDCQEDWCCPPSKEQKVPLLHENEHH